MCIGGGSSATSAATPKPPPAPTPVTASRLERRPATVDREGRKRRRGSARSRLVIPRKESVSMSSSGTGVNY